MIRTLKLPSIDGLLLVDLDRIYPRLLQGSWIVLSDPHAGARTYRVIETSIVFRSDPAVQSKTTRIRTDTQKDLHIFSICEAIVYLQSEPLSLAEVSLEMLLEGDEIEFDRHVPDLEKGHVLIVSGKRMRGQVRGSKMKMALPDGRERTLNQGDYVVVMRRISAVDEDLRMSWNLMDADGYSGVVYCDTQDLDLMGALAEDDTISEAVSVKGVFSRDGRTVAVFEEPMRNTYDRATLMIYANVVVATHGETVQEVLGSGESTQINQRFSLKKTPLTFVPSINHGFENTLEVRVNDMVWTQSPSLHNLNESDKSYKVQIGDDGKITIIFGDGKNGARLPTGVENVRANYRWGIGPDGIVPAGSLTLMQARPRGIRSVTNPLPAFGAESPESILDMRQHLPRTILTLDRIVSLKDYEDFAGTFPGIAKAQVRIFHLKSGRLIHITIASSEGTVMDPPTGLIKNLLKAIEGAGNSLNRVEIRSAQLRTFSIEAGVLVDERFTLEKVFDQVKALLKREFSFENRALGQSVSDSEVISCMQRVEGVVALDLNRMELDPERMASGIQRAPSIEDVKLKSMLDQSLPPTNQFLPPKKMIARTSDKNRLIKAEAARLIMAEGTTEILPAELILINPDIRGIVLRDMRA